jgi:MFS family permease
MNQPAKNEIPERSPWFFGWRVLFGAVMGLAFSPGPVALLLIGGLAPGLAHANGWSFRAIMFSLTILNIASILAAPAAGYLTDRLGPRLVLLPSIVIMAGCLLLWGYAATSLVSLYAISALYGFATIGAQSLTYNKLLTGWFRDNLGIVLGIAASGLGLGYAILPLIIGFGLGHFGPAGTTALLAGVLIVVSLTVNIFVARPNPAASSEKASISGASEGLSLREAAATSTFWIMAGTIFLVSIIATGIVPNFTNIARDAKYTISEAATIASLFGFATLGGRLLVGWLFDRFFAPRVASLIFLLAAAGYGLAAMVTAFGLEWQILAVAAIMMGLGFGAESDLIGYLANRYFGYRHFGAIYGTLLAVFILGVSAGPLLYGAVRDQAGGYQPILAAAAVLGLGASLLMLLLPRFPVEAGRSRDGEIPSNINVSAAPRT